MQVEEILWHLAFFNAEQNWLEAEYIGFLIRLAEKKLKKKYKKILDVACGSGRYHSYLRQLGFEVYGIDISEKLLNLAKERNQGYESYYELKDMRKLDYHSQFDVILSWFTSFGYFDDATNRKIIQSFFTALKPGGILILDVPATVSLLANKSLVIDYGDYVVLEQYKKLDYRTVSLTFRLYRKENMDLKFVKELKMKLIIYPPEELKEILEAAGFRILFVFKGRSISEVRNKLSEVKEGRLVWVCYKPE